jgi:hypothetical protein
MRGGGGGARGDHAPSPCHCRPDTTEALHFPVHSGLQTLRRMRHAKAILQKLHSFPCVREHKRNGSPEQGHVPLRESVPVSSWASYLLHWNRRMPVANQHSASTDAACHTWRVGDGTLCKQYSGPACAGAQQWSRQARQGMQENQLKAMSVAISTAASCLG